MKRILFFEKEGQLLIEVLFAIAVAGIIVSSASGLIYVSLQGNKIYTDNNIAVGLADETLEGVRAVAFERWQTLYSLTKNSNYYPSIVSDPGVNYQWINHTPGSGLKWGTVNAVNGVSAYSPRNIWIVGPSSMVWHWDGENWTQF